MLPRRTLLITILLLLSAGPLRAGEHRVTTLDVGEGNVRAIRIRDLGGDGVPDLVAFVDGAKGPFVHVFPLAGEGGPPAEPVVLAPSRAGLNAVYYYCLARTAAGGGFEIIAVDRWQGVVAVALGTETTEDGVRRVLLPPRPIAKGPEVPFRPEPGRIKVLDAATDLDGDGDDELLLPGAGGYRVVPTEKDPKGDPVEVPTGIDHELSVPDHKFLSLTWILPRLTTADWDGDGRPDLVGGHEGHLLVFLQREDGSFLRAAAPFDALDPGPDPANRNAFTLGDVDRDGRVDLLLTRSPTSIGLLRKFTSRQYLLLNPDILSTERPGRLSTPACAIKTEGYSVNPGLLDFDGDGDLDLVVTSLALDMKSRMLKNVSAIYLLYRFDGDSRVFEQEPHFRVSRPYPVSQLESYSTAPVCFFTGDFDGDGKRDLLDIADDGHVTVLQGTTQTGLLASDSYGFKDPIFRVPIEMGNDVRVLDLNDDGISDLVGYRGSRIHVLRSVK